METVDVIIPVYKPDRGFLTLVEKLETQSHPVNQIIIMNTEQKYFDRLFYGTVLERTYHNITVKHLSKREFDHGHTRNQGVRLSKADVFLMMTQDAMPADEYLVERLLAGLRDEGTAAAYARQAPGEKAARSSGIRGVLTTRRSLSSRRRRICRSWGLRLFSAPTYARPISGRFSTLSGDLSTGLYLTRICFMRQRR